MYMNLSRRRGLAGLVVAGALALPASAGAAGPDPLAGGETTLAVKATVAAALDDAGIGVKPTRPAEAGGGGIAFPITGGRLDPQKLRGTLEHRGGLKFTRGSRSVVVKNYDVKLGKNPRLIGEAGEARFKVFDLDVSDARVRRDGFATKISGVRAELAPGAAKALNATLGIDAFAGGLVVGKVKTNAVPKSVAILSKRETTLAIDSGAASALASEGITPGVIAPASAGAGGLEFPITGGRVNAETLAGSVRHSGGISLTKSSTVVELRRFVIRIDEDPDLTALVGDDRVSILDLDLAGAGIAIDGRRVTVSGVEATLTGAAADALNAAFSTGAFHEGLLLGEATVRAVAR